MKRKSLLLFIASCFWACQPTADSANETTMSMESTDEISAVNAAVETLRMALIDPTSEKLAAIALPELTYGHSTGTIEDYATFSDVLLTGKNDYKNYDISEQVVIVVGQTAWVRHIMDATVGIINEDGTPGEVVPHLNVLTVWVKKDGAWKLLARQAVKV